MIIFVFFNFLAFWPFPWQWQPFWKNQHLKAQFHMAYDMISIVGRQIVSGLRFQWKLISRMYFEVRNWLKFRPNRRIFFILVAILDSKWSPYGVACLTSCKYSFPLKSFHFLIIIIIIIIIIIPLLLAVILSDQILRDWWSDLY
jgi:hypothetical protein